MTAEAHISSLFQPFSVGKGFFYCIKICIYIDDCCGSGRLLRETFNIPVCRVHTLCTPPSFRLLSAGRDPPICSIDGAFSLHSTNGRKQKSRQKALLPRPSDGYRVQNKNASIVSILTFLYGGELGIRTLGEFPHTAFRVLHHRPLGQLSNIELLKYYTKIQSENQYQIKNFYQSNKNRHL